MNKVLFFGCIALVSLALLGGFMVAGGPGYARFEKEEQQRVIDLRKFGEFKTCELTLSSQAKDCDGLAGSENPADTLTGDRFTFEQISDKAFKVCAVFKVDPEALNGFDSRLLSFKGQTGCYTYRLDANSEEWIRRKLRP